MLPEKCCYWILPAALFPYSALYLVRQRIPTLATVYGPRAVRIWKLDSISLHPCILQSLVWYRVPVEEYRSLVSGRSLQFRIRCLLRQWIRFFASIGISAPCIWQSLVRRCSCLRSTFTSFFWEKISGYAVFSASWFDSAYRLLPVYGLCGNCVSVCSAMLGPQWYMLCVSHGVRPRILRSILVATADSPHLQLIHKSSTSLLWHRDWLIHMVHTVLISFEIHLLPVDKVVDVPLWSSTSLL